MSDTARFDAVENDPEFEAAMGHEPEVVSLPFVVAAGGMFAGSVVFAAVSVMILFALPAPLVLELVWCALAAGFVVFAGKVLWSAWRYHAAPILRFIGLVAGSRTQISTAARDGTVSTSYFVTIETRDGSRTEYYAVGTVAGLVQRGDIGVAYLKSKTIVAFRRFSV